jgi:DNA polymerase II small subunit/DNA polymerase delta subunit B
MSFEKFSENIQNINLSSLKLVSNPYFFNIFVPSLNQEKYFIGSSGENINIIRQYSCYENTIDIMKKNLEWKHLCPINPSYSYLYSLDNMEDPLVLNRIPDVYFTSGNKDLKYEKIEIDNKKIFLISLPDFEKTSKCASYNYEDDSLIQIDFSFDF